MTTVYRLNEAQLDERFLKAVRAQFKGKDIEITIEDADETAYLLANEANRERLMAAIKHVESGGDLVELPEEALK